MRNRSTDDLTEELMASASIDAYLRGNAEIFSDQDITEHLAQLYERQTLSKAALARRSAMSEVYLHQVFSGRRNPSRDGCCAFASGWRSPWRRPSSCSSRPPTRRSTRSRGGRPSSPTGSPTA